MVSFRTFRNSDPPELHRLWHTCELGRGAALGFDIDVLEALVFSQTYFDPAGVILAEHGGRVVGFVHAGFGPSDELSRIGPQTGVICVVMVEPQFRRQGIGRQLIAEAERYLRERGAERFLAGPAEPHDPFYFGIYGGSQPAGYLASDPHAAPFFQALGYTPFSERMVMQRDLSTKTSPVGLRLMSIRRNTQLSAPDVRRTHPWWWNTRVGRLDTIELALAPKAGGHPFAYVTAVGLDFYMTRWQQRAIGLMDLYVPQEHRRKGYGQALLVEVCRRVREEMITLAEAHAPADDAQSIAALTSAGFAPVDRGTVYQKSITGA